MWYAPWNQRGNPKGTPSYTPALHVSWALMVLKSVNSHWPTVVPFLQGQLMTKPWVHLQENWESPGARDTNAKRVASPADGARAVNEPLPGSLRIGSFELSPWRRSVGPDAHYVPLLCAPICPMTIRGSLDYGSGVISVPYSSLRRG